MKILKKSSYQYYSAKNRFGYAYANVQTATGKKAFCFEKKASRTAFALALEPSANTCLSIRLCYAERDSSFPLKRPSLPSMPTTVIDPKPMILIHKCNSSIFPCNGQNKYKTRDFFVYSMVKWSHDWAVSLITGFRVLKLFA